MEIAAQHSDVPSMADPVPQDIEEAAGRIPPQAIQSLRAANLLVTGGTGFLGSWLVDVLLALGRRHQLGLSITLLTRNKSALAGRRPDWQAAEEITFIEGDVRNFATANTCFSHVVHAATDVSTSIVSQLELAESIVEGSRCILQMAARGGTKRYLYFSSGAVVGQPVEHQPITEEAASTLMPDDPTAYAHAKRYAEHLHLLAAAEHGFEMVIARGFAFVGPRMPLEKFAIGNFIRDALAGISPRLNTAGLATRSYLYAADAARWLVMLLTQGTANEIYNVGSDQAISVRQLADRVASVLGSLPPVPGCGDDVSYYVPDTRKIRSALDIGAELLLDDAIRKTAQWALNSKALSGCADFQS